MIIGIGIDLVKIERIQQMVQRWDKRFLDRVFTPIEQSYSLSSRYPYPRFAARFAIKEAVMKAIGTGWRSGVKWTDIELRNEPSGKPIVQLYGKVKHWVDAHGVTDIHASVSHDAEYSIGQVMLIGNKKSKNC